MFSVLELVVCFSLSVLECGDSFKPNASVLTAEFNFSTANGPQVQCESSWNECEGEHVCRNAFQFQGTTSGLGCVSRIPENLSRVPGECVLVPDPHGNGNGECKFVNPCVARRRSCSSSEHECVPITSTASPLSCSSSATISPPPPNRPCSPVNGSCAFTAHQCVKWRGFCNDGYHCGTAIEHYRFTQGPQPRCAPPLPGSTPPLPPGECIYQDGVCVWSNCSLWLTLSKEANCQPAWMCGTDYDRLLYAADASMHCEEPLTKQSLPTKPATPCKYNITSGQCQYMSELCSTTECPSNSRCVVHTSMGSPTGLEICLPSCFMNNGGCAPDQVCTVEPDGSCTNKPCSSIKCIRFHDYYSSRCPAGKEYKECGTGCPSTCETFGHFPDCLSGCVKGCFCPAGLVEYRDRCVDPLECPALLANPPPLDPLPVPENAILVQLTITDMTLEEFGSVQKSLLDALSKILQDHAVFSASVEIYKIMKGIEQEEIIVVVKITGGDLMEDDSAAEKVVVIIQNNLGILPVTIHAVSAVSVHPEQGSKARRSPLAPLVSVVLVLALVMFGVTVICVVVVGVVKFKITYKLTQPQQAPGGTVGVISWSKPPPAIKGTTESDGQASQMHNAC